VSFAALGTHSLATLLPAAKKVIWALEKL